MCRRLSDFFPSQSLCCGTIRRGRSFSDLAMVGMLANRSAFDKPSLQSFLFPNRLRQSPQRVRVREASVAIIVQGASRVTLAPMQALTRCSRRGVSAPAAVPAVCTG